MSVLCYNKGCGQRFDPENNSDDACTYHPGVPVFHDALKGWSCCKRRTTDFSDFLSIAGCTKGPHNQEKPAEPVKPEVKSTADKTANDKPKFDECIIQAPKPLESIQRPSSDEPFSTLQKKISPSLKQALEKLKLTDENAPVDKEEESDEIKIGTSCKNGGCGKTFSGPASDDEMCLYHAGVPIFHEGMKYWSCCKRKTSDFNTFLSQEGCTDGKHQWRKKDTGKKVVPCRFDWHQTGSQVIISIYAKNSIPELSSVEGNSTVDSTTSSDFTPPTNTGARPKKKVGKGSRKGRREDIDADRERRLNNLKERRNNEIQTQIQSLTAQEKDHILQKVMLRLPGVMFDVLALHEDGERPRIPDGGGLHWCTCTNCREMDSDLERLCCRQAPQNCISRMAYMQYYILDEGVLRLARAAWNDIFAVDDAQEPGVEQRQYRHTAYRQFVLWQHGRLGVGNRVVIPSCCVWRIRETFPDPRGQYTGFRVRRLL